MRVSTLFLSILATWICLGNAKFQPLGSSVQEAQIREAMQELQQNINFNESNLPYWSSNIDEPSCWRLHMCLRVFFKRKLSFIFNKNAKNGYGGLNITVFPKRDILRTARNLLGTPVTLTREKSSVDIESTTSGWTIGVGSNVGGFKFADQLFAQGGLTISASYSNHLTTMKQLSVSDSSSFSCPSGFVCTSEAWTIYVKIKGPCQGTNKVECEWNKIDPCAQSGLPNGWECSQMLDFKNKVCKPQVCEVVAPVFEGDKPLYAEVFFQRPIAGFHPKPKITGYSSGFYHLGSQDYIYDATRYDDKFWKSSLGWHINDAYPNLGDEVAKFKHQVPQLLGFESRCYKLDSMEWYCPLEPLGKRYSGGVNVGGVLKQKYAREEIPEPSTQAMAKCLEDTMADMDMEANPELFVQLTREFFRLYMEQVKLSEPPSASLRGPILWAKRHGWNNIAEMLTKARRLKEKNRDMPKNKRGKKSKTGGRRLKSHENEIGKPVEDATNTTVARIDSAPTISHDATRQDKKGQGGRAKVLKRSRWA
ncbi:hypothetical protein CDD81_5619 [Ophiocordyceps australis]|uniref:Uncharacterized protein n=1 Tax=Ophiocordyceps australis TaxID=1399860 RepID=A0A2C5XIA3_9HYPO|nr:hypothetical protein CDD81_5619 [Ophiocordyceps australis]